MKETMAFFLPSFNLRVILLLFAVVRQSREVYVSSFFVDFELPRHSLLYFSRKQDSMRNALFNQKKEDVAAADNLNNHTKRIVYDRINNGDFKSSRSETLFENLELNPQTARSTSTKKSLNTHRKDDAIISLNLSLKALAKSKERGAARRAEQLLFRVEKLYRDGYYSRKPDLVSYNTVMDAWARSGEKDSAKRAEQLLQRLEEMHNNHGGMKPNTRSYNTVMNAFAKSSQPGSAARARELLEQMEEMYRISKSSNNSRSRTSVVKPDTITYNCVLDALAKAKDYKNSVQDAEKLLRKMKKLNKEGDSDVVPNARSVGSVIHALANSNTKNNNYENAANAHRALDLLREMENEYETESNLNMKPTIYTYNMVISCLSKCSSVDPNIVTQVEELLAKMEHLSSLGDISLKPTLITYSSVLNCYAKSQLPDKASRAEKLLLRMEERYNSGIDLSVKPDTIAYSTVLFCWANSQDENAPINAERLLHRMEHLAGKDTNIRPNEKCYSAVISAWAKSHFLDAAQNAENVLQRMEYMFESGICDSLPNTICCNAVLNCYAKSQLLDKAQRALYLVQRMNEQHQSGIQEVKADIISYNCLFNACATSTEDSDQRKRALDIVLTTFKTLYQTKAFNLTSHTYASLLKAFGNLTEMSEERITLMKTVFRLCCDEGQVDRPVLKELQRTLPAELCNQLVRGYVTNGKPDVEAIPFGWRRNIMNSIAPIE